MTKPHIAILYPCSFPNIPTGPAINHMQLLSEVAKNKDLEMWQFLHNNNVPLDFSRNKLITEALGIDGVTHVWFLDADQYYSGEMLTKLLEADKDIIGPLVFMRGGGTKHHGPIAQNPRGEGFTPVNIFTPTGEIDIKDYPEKCGLIGFGGLLIKIEVLRAMDYPWVMYDRSGVDIWSGTSEDVYFCKKAIASGHEIWVHCDVISLHDSTTRVDHTVWTDYQKRRAQGMVKMLPHAQATDDYKNYGADFFEHPHQTNWTESAELWDSMVNIFVDQCDRQFGQVAWLKKFIMDFGSGTGVFDKAMNITDPSGEKPALITNYDPSEYAQKTYGAMAWHELAPKYDIIFSTEVLEHCLSTEDARVAIAKMVSLSPELIICTINTKQGIENFPTHTCMHNRQWWLNLFGEFPELVYDKEASDIAMGKDRYKLQWFVFTKANK